MTIQLSDLLGFKTATMALPANRSLTHYSSKACLEILQKSGKQIDVKKVFLLVILQSLVEVLFRCGGLLPPIQNTEDRNIVKT